MTTTSAHLDTRYYRFDPRYGVSFDSTYADELDTATMAGVELLRDWYQSAPADAKALCRKVVQRHLNEAQRRSSAEDVGTFFALAFILQ